MAKQKAFPLVDSDVHHQYASYAALAPYMPDGDASGVYMPTGSGGNPRGGMRNDVAVPEGGVVGSDPQTVVDEHLDLYGIDYAVLNPGSPLGVGGLPFLDLAADIASATNDWTINEWFPADERFLGSVLIAPRDPVRAAAEVRRVGSHPRMVQVTMTSAPCLMGSSFMHPVYEACNELGLPINLHVGGHDAGINSGSYAVGFPTSFFERHIGMCIPAIHHLISMVAEGVFVKFPNVHLILNEFGSSWLPFVMWRLDMEYRSCREDVPWLTQLPSEYIKQFVRLTTQPLELPEDPKDMVTLLSLIDAQDLLLFSSDYPHWDFDNPDFALKTFPDDWKRKIMWENARDLFKLEEPANVRHAVTAAR